MKKIRKNRINSVRIKNKNKFKIMTYKKYLKN